MKTLVKVGPHSTNNNNLTPEMVSRKNTFNLLIILNMRDNRIVREAITVESR